MNRLLMDMKITAIGEYKIVEMDTNKIDVSKQNARRLDVTKEIEELVQSIKDIGLQQHPIIQKKCGIPSHLQRHRRVKHWIIQHWVKRLL